MKTLALLVAASLSLSFGVACGSGGSSESSTDAGQGGAGAGGTSGSGGSSASGGSGGSGGVPPSGGGGSGGSSGSAGTCCTVHSTPGCTNASIQACVCAQDSYCCSTDWDSTCVSEVTSFGCGSCSGGSGGSGGSSGSGGSGGGTGQVCGTVTCGSAASCCTCSGQKICISLPSGYTCSSWSSTCS